MTSSLVQVAVQGNIYWIDLEKVASIFIAHRIAPDSQDDQVRIDTLAGSYAFRVGVDGSFDELTKVANDLVVKWRNYIDRKRIQQTNIKPTRGGPTPA